MKLVGTQFHMTSTIIARSTEKIAHCARLSIGHIASDETEMYVNVFFPSFLCSDWFLIPQQTAWVHENSYTPEHFGRYFFCL